MMQSFHQSAEAFEILFNKTKYDALSDTLKNIIANAVEAASADMSWKAIDRYSQDYIALQAENKVKVYKTPDSVLQAQLKIWDETIAKKSAENPWFKKVLDSQKTFAERTTRWQYDQNVDFRIAVNHYFGKKA
jgi:TRAP-type mannitol/chloroaromatic compound transport system substrate-binding protein